MTSLRVLATLPDSRVAIIVPSSRCVDAMRTGGRIHPFAVMHEASKFIAEAGWRPDRTPAERADIAMRWIGALAFGGLDEREAVGLIGEVAAPPYATALEIVGADELPADRTHRDAWRRSTNGGPVWIDEEAAQALDEARAWAAYEGRA